MHSSMYESILTWYNLKVWDETKVRNAVIKGKITPEEFTEITGLPY